MRRAIVIAVLVVLISHYADAAGRNVVASYVAPALTSDTPVIGLAAYQGDISTLRRCITAGLGVESAGKQQRTPLLLASAGGHIDAVKILLKAGANINGRDRGGVTALHWATHRGETKIALLLLKNHAAVNVQDQFGEAPLIWAAMAGDKTVVEALLRLGANRNLKNVDGWTAERLAKRNKHADVVALLENAP